jgi:Na+/H+ antiporter NhaD/arsenite permease-like protein
MPTPHLSVPIYAILPFVLMLAGIAILPLAAPSFWERNRNKALFAGILAAPITIWLLYQGPSYLWQVGRDYFSFICLLGSLFVVTGGIHLGGDLRATPRNNTILLGAGSVLASLLGTTGASMLLIRLLLRTNAQRRHTSHIPFFFILLVSNAGGLLTPLGDPPLFLGFLRGVPFHWTLRLFPIWLLAVGYLLTLFYWLDRRAYAREAAIDIERDLRQVIPFKLEGRLNLVWLLAVVLSVFLPSPVREIAMMVASLASLTSGNRSGRKRNQFTFAPMTEVAVLFAGIFVTMAPALMLLERTGPDLGLVEPWHFFVASGVLSSVLDNAPTYLTFLTAAQSTASALGLPVNVVAVPVGYLAAISAGSVLMGANTYIGNGPNFMVKSMAESAGYRMPGFARYAMMAVVVLLPVYLVTSLMLAHY